MSIRIEGPFTIVPLDEPDPEPKRGWYAPGIFFLALAIVGVVLIGSIP